MDLQYALNIIKCFIVNFEQKICIKVTQSISFTTVDVSACTQQYCPYDSLQPLIIFLSEYWGLNILNFIFENFNFKTMCLSNAFFSEPAIPINTKFDEKFGSMNPIACNFTLNLEGGLYICKRWVKQLFSSNATMWEY